MLEASEGVCLRKELSQIYGVVDDMGFQLLHCYWHLHCHAPMTAARRFDQQNGKWVTALARQ